MKKYLFILINSCISFLCLGQDVENIQGTVKSEPGYIVAVYFTPTLPVTGNAGNNTITFNITTSFAQAGFQNAPTPALSHQLGGTITIFPGLNTPSLENGRYVYNYILVGTIPNFTWNAGVERAAMKLDFSADPNFTSNYPWLQHSPTGGPNSTSVFYPEVNGNDLTNYTDMFYGGSEGTQGGYNYVQAVSALPINLVAFDVEKSGEKNAYLTWTTSSETNSSHFVIERSTDKKSWTNVGKVKAAGDSQMILNYSFLDENVYNGREAQLKVYYRLQIVDLDGQSKYSPLDDVLFGNISSAAREFAVYPNPSTDGLNVQWDANSVDQPTALEFFDIEGKLVYSQKVSENTNQSYVDFGRTTIQPGLYLLRILNGIEPLDYKQIVVGNR